jgi:hypothetical protein
VVLIHLKEDRFYLTLLFATNLDTVDLLTPKSRPASTPLFSPDSMSLMRVASWALEAGRAAYTGDG